MSVNITVTRKYRDKNYFDDKSGGDTYIYAGGSRDDIGDFYTTDQIDSWRNGVTQAEMGYLDGVTSGIQNQLNNKDNYQNWSALLDGGNEMVITTGEQINFIGGTDIGLSPGTIVGDHSITINFTGSVPNYTEGEGIDIDSADVIRASLHTGGGLKFDGINLDQLAVDTTVISAVGHNHDTRYYTESEVNTWRNGVTQTEMGYLHGVSSDIQTQLNNKDNYQSWSALVDGGSTMVITTGEQLNFIAGSGITLSPGTAVGDHSIEITSTASGVSSAYTTIQSGVQSFSASGAETLELESTDNSITLTLTSGTPDSVDFAVNESNVNHNLLLNYASNRHFLMTDIDHLDTALSTGLVKNTTGTGVISIITDNSSNWNTAYGWGNHASAGYLSDLSDDVSPTLGGDLALAAGNYIKMPSSIAQTDGAGIIITGQVDVNGFGIGCALGVAADGNWESCDSDVSSDFPCSGIALEAGTGAGKKILLYGVLSDASYSFTAGLPVYVHTTDGGLTTAPVAGTGDTLQRVGVALDGDTVLFTPSLDVIEIG